MAKVLTSTLLLLLLDSSSSSLLPLQSYITCSKPGYCSPKDPIEETFQELAFDVCRLGRINETTQDPVVVPAHISIPLLDAASQLHREPTVGYHSLVLDNCVRLEGPVHRPDSWLIPRTITTIEADGQVAHDTEIGFYRAHCAVEEKLAPCLPIIGRQAALNETDFTDLGFIIRAATPMLKQMAHFFHPQDFFPFLRPSLKCGDSFSRGVIFEGPEGSSWSIEFPDGTSRDITANEVVHGLRGPTGAMTASLPAIDARLGISEHVEVDFELADTMKAFNKYQHQSHQIFRRDLLAGDSIRHSLLHDDQQHLRPLFDDVLVALAEFRFAHVNHVSTYIVNSLPGVDTREIRGTGGTPIFDYLCRAALGTLSARFDPDSKADISIPSLCVSFCRGAGEDEFEAINKECHRTVLAQYN